MPRIGPHRTVAGGTSTEYLGNAVADWERAVETSILIPTQNTERIPNQFFIVTRRTNFRAMNKAGYPVLFQVQVYGASESWPEARVRVAQVLAKAGLQGDGKERFAYETTDVAVAEKRHLALVSAIGTIAQIDYTGTKRAPSYTFSYNDPAFAHKDF